MTDICLTLDDVSVRYRGHTALDGVRLTVGRGEILCLAGPSGSGKTTLLRTVAGLERPAAGRVLIDGVEVVGASRFVEPEHRQVGMVFQDLALFPHLTVAANVAFGLRTRSREDSDRIVMGLLDRVHLRPHAASYPHTLSGGERQRAALARALAPAPRVLLMDEPFSSLDGRLRDQVRRDTLDLLRDLGTTTIVVTHDPDEALRMADRIALLRQGRIVECGAPETMYARPGTRFTARFFGDLNDVAATCRSGRLETALGSFPADGLTERQTARVCVRPQHVRLAGQPTALAGTVSSSTFLGAYQETEVRLAGSDTSITLRTPSPTCLARGDLVYLDIRGQDVFVLAEDGEV